MLKRWAFLLEIPKERQERLDKLAQSTIRYHRKAVFPSSIRYPIADPQGNEFWTLDAYLKSAYWTSVKTRTLYLRGSKCEECGAAHDLDTHHLSYEKVGSEDSRRLVVMCETCWDYLYQQMRTGRRYGWKVQPLQVWLITTKQARERRLARRLERERLAAEADAATPIPAPGHASRTIGKSTGNATELLILDDEDGEFIFLDIINPEGGE